MADESEDEPPAWADLLLPPAFGDELTRVERPDTDATVDLDGLFPVDGVARPLAPRQFWLSTLHNGRIFLGGAYAALGRPAEVAVVCDLWEPGAALVDARLIPEDGPEYPRLTVGASRNSGRVSLSAAVLHRLQAGHDGGQVLMTMAGGFLVLLNPTWTVGLPWWDKMAEEKFS